MNQFENIEGQFSIRDLSEVSGVNSVTLRAWERRYGLLKPERTAKGHRYYHQSDVEKIRQILRWIDRGVAISKVKPLLEQTHLTQDESETTAGEDWKKIMSEILESASAFRCEKLSNQMQDIFLNYPLDTLANNFFPPLFQDLEKRSNQQPGSHAEKKFIETELSLRLQSQIHQQNANNQGERILLTILGKDDRQYRSLLFTLALLEAGYRVNLFIDGCQLREIPLVAEKNPVKAVICYSDIRIKETLLEQELKRCSTHTKLPFFVAGEWVNIDTDITQISGIIPLPTSLRKAIQTLQKYLDGKPHDEQ